jgi:nickel superoxide dismutase
MIRSSFFLAVAAALIVIPLTSANEPTVNDPTTTPVTTAEPVAAIVATPAPAATPAPVPHCQVPCGIYGDQMRFEGMLEDTKTIAKAIASIGEFTDGIAGGGGLNPKAINQNVRWVTTKEDHATNIQNVMGQYFFAQRIKGDHKDYQGQLATAHRIIVAAMKCKQDADPATADALKSAILEFYEAYEGKKPEFHEEEK